LLNQAKWHSSTKAKLIGVNVKNEGEFQLIETDDITAHWKSSNKMQQVIKEVEIIF